MAAVPSPTIDRSLPRPRRRRLRRFLKWLAIGIASLLLVGVVVQTIASALDQRTYQPPGRMVAIDGGKRRIHLQVEGEARGLPTVILEAGMASFSSNWHWVQTRLADSTQVVAADRAGLGWSDPSPEPHDAYDSARDLHQALRATGVSGPYLVAGHSYGGLVVRAFADLFHDEVVGMVLVDASHPDQWTRIPASDGGRRVALGNRVTGWLSRIGLLRVLGLIDGISDGLPERQVAELRANLSRPRAWMTSSRVLSLWDERTRPKVNGAPSLGSKPVAVLGVSDQPRSGAVLTALQAELPGISSNSYRQIVEGANHGSLVANRGHAEQVAGAILRVLAAARSGGKVAPDQTAQR
jgi:pimeloyl-ACP methyl ester carboxylesterase